jgi:hypothetical protein
MQRLALGAAAADCAAYALHRLTPKVHEMHAHPRVMMRTHCVSASLRPKRCHGAPRQPPCALFCARHESRAGARPAVGRPDDDAHPGYELANGARKACMTGVSMRSA